MCRAVVCEGDDEEVDGMRGREFPSFFFLPSRGARRRGEEGRWAEDSRLR